MDYNSYNNAYGGMPTQNKKDRPIGGIILIILLIIAIGTTGYITYKVLTEDDGTGDISIKEDNNKNVLSDEDALKVGNELYKTGYKLMFGRESELSMENCKKAYDESQKYFVNGAKVNYTPSYYRSEIDIKYGTVEKNFYNESGSLDCQNIVTNNTYYIGEENLKIASKKEKIITFDKVATYCDKNTFDHMEEQDLSKCPRKVTTTYKFIIEKEGSDWKISKLSVIN